MAVEAGSPALTTAPLAGRRRVGRVHRGIDAGGFDHVVQPTAGGVTEFPRRVGVAGKERVGGAKFPRIAVCRR